MMYCYLAVVLVLVVNAQSSGSGDSSSSPAPTTESTPTPHPKYTTTYITGSGSSYSTTTPGGLPTTTPNNQPTTTPDRTTEFSSEYKDTTTPESTTIMEDKDFSGSGSGSEDVPDNTALKVTILVGDDAIFPEECNTIDCKEDVIQEVFSSYINYLFQWESITNYNQTTSDIECARSCFRVKDCDGFHYQHPNCALIISSTPP